MILIFFLQPSSLVFKKAYKNCIGPFFKKKILVFKIIKQGFKILRKKNSFGFQSANFHKLIIKNSIISNKKVFVFNYKIYQKM